MQNNLKQMFKKNKKSGPEDLAKFIGISPTDVHLLVEDKRAFTLKEFLQTCAFLKTSADKIYGLDTKGLNTKTWDVTLYDCIVFHLLDDCRFHKVKPKKKDISIWAVLAFKAAVTCHYNVVQVSKLTDALVEISTMRSNDKLLKKVMSKMRVAS